MQNPQQSSNTRFLLDESLPPQVADVLNQVGYSITSCRAEGLAGRKDEELIPWMAERDYVRVTKDDAAGSAHQDAIRRSQISVVWVRGLERRNRTATRNTISVKELHRMLTDELDAIRDIVAQARGPRYFMVYLRNYRPVLKHYTNLEGFGR